MANKFNKERCVEKWKGDFDSDKRIQYASDLFDEWIQTIPADCEEICSVLLENFEYYSHRRINEYLAKLYTKLREMPEVTDQNTIYTFLRSEDGQINSSMEYQIEFRKINHLNKYICYDNIDQITSTQWQFISNVVIVDDFGGTGRSFLKYIQEYKDIFCRKNVFFLVVDVMSEAKRKIEKYGIENHINIQVLNMNIQEKAFSRQLFSDESSAKRIFCSLSKKMKINKKRILGYGDSESLVAFHNNTPNNTLGLFYWETESNKPLFPREDPKRPNWQKMSCEKTTQKKANYQNEKKRNVPNG